ncbi:MAG TPA: hypothetical protein VN549_00330, partial [Negativicutes bacterium]|nr:hypothetical protein [Negativicutes bacterium]
CTTNQPAPATTPTPTPTAQATPTTTPTATPTQAADTVTTASIVDNNAAFEKAISGTGTWIIAILKDLTFDKDLVLEGEFKNGKKDTAGKDIIQRKIALYSQDANRNITARYTLTAPKLTIKSPQASIQHGTFKGNLYVTTNDFKLVDATVDGNIYFSSDDAKKGFSMDDKSKVTGKQEVKK